MYNEATAHNVVSELLLLTIMPKKCRKKLTYRKGDSRKTKSIRTPANPTEQSESDQNLPVQHQNVPGTSVNPDVAVGIPSPAKKIKILQNILIKPPRKTNKPPNPLKGKTRIGYYSKEVQQKADCKPECRDGPVFFSVTQHIVQGMVAERAQRGTCQVEPGSLLEKLLKLYPSDRDLAEADSHLYSIFLVRQSTPPSPQRKRQRSTSIDSDDGMPQAKITVQAMVHRTADDTIIPRETPVLHTDVRPPPINHTDDVQRPSVAPHLDNITAILATSPPLPQQVHGNARQDPTRIREEVELDVNRRRNQGNHLPTYLMAHERVTRFGPSDLGSLNRMCNHCNARYFTAEMTARREYTHCCHKGKVSLEPLVAMPDVLKNLFRGTHPSSRHFRRYVLCYNHAFQFVSLEATLRDLPPGRAPPIYAIQGKMYHHISDVNVNARRQRYGPVYFLDPEASVDQRVDNNQALERPLIARLEALFREINPYARAYMHLRERYNSRVTMHYFISLLPELPSPSIAHLFTFLSVLQNPFFVLVQDLV
ncbi:hypothetical protein NQ315_004543 [Exocentrus adspersus]|uniref:Helitron helicase-like domain-containing protein n=1 Tax=Exocentrus adspersus TaxID=1586481 RepID=A0AAV8V844_9CUCU|nr:hypothetical protein NQ315_004543 [Exocentrus adspersus]